MGNWDKTGRDKRDGVGGGGRRGIEERGDQKRGESENKKTKQLMERSREGRGEREDTWRGGRET